MSRHHGGKSRPLPGYKSIRGPERAGQARPRATAPPTPRAPKVNGTLPEGYGETRVVLLPIDPYRVHVYWEVSGSNRRRVKALIEDGSLRPQAVLRFHDVTALPVGGVLASGSFDEEIEIESCNWYVHLRRPGRSYIADLGLRGTDGLFHRIGRSNRAETPRARPYEEAGPQRMRVVQVDGAVQLHHLGESPVVCDPAAVSEVSEIPPRVEMPLEGRRAVVGMPGLPAVGIRADKIPEIGTADGPTGPPGEGGIRRIRKEPGTEKAQRTPEIEGQGRESGLPRNPGPIHASETLRTKPEEIYERRKRLSQGEKGPGPENPSAEKQGSTEIDLSLLCEYFFVSGLSSGQVVKGAKSDDEDTG